MSPAFDADIERGHIVLEINRQAVASVGDFQRMTARARPGDILTMYVYKPELNQRTLETVKLDQR
jgi:S1-C subfamily serine protease